jgi:hypothetical protein
MQHHVCYSIPPWRNRTFHNGSFREFAARPITLDGVSAHEQLRWLETAHVDLSVLSLQCDRAIRGRFPNVVAISRVIPPNLRCHFPPAASKNEHNSRQQKAPENIMFSRALSGCGDRI